MEPGSKLAATGWVTERVVIEALSGLRDDAAYRGMDFLLEALDEVAAQIFASVAHLLNLDLDIVFVGTTSTYCEADGPDLLADLADPVDDDGVEPPERGSQADLRSFQGLPHRSPQVVIAMAVTRDGIPVRCWTY